MTNREKAESCGEFVRDGLDALRDTPDRGVLGHIIGDWATERDHIVEGARQAGHWGRLALVQAKRKRTVQAKLERDAAWWAAHDRRGLHG